jgi:hypothetical protein
MQVILPQYQLEHPLNPWTSSSIPVPLTFGLLGLTARVVKTVLQPLIRRNHPRLSQPPHHLRHQVEEEATVVAVVEM